MNIISKLGAFFILLVLFTSMTSAGIVKEPIVSPLIIGLKDINAINNLQAKGNYLCSSTQCFNINDIGAAGSGDSNITWTDINDLFVPYQGAKKDVNLGNNDLNLDNGLGDSPSIYLKASSSRLGQITQTGGTLGKMQYYSNGTHDFYTDGILALSIGDITVPTKSFYDINLQRNDITARSGVFTNDINVGTRLSGNDANIKILASTGENASLMLSEMDGTTQPYSSGFELKYDGGNNLFYLIAHPNSVNGTGVIRIMRDVFGISIGQGANGSSANATAIGRDASASGLKSSAIGFHTTVTREQGTAIGNNSTVQLDGNNGVAIGYRATADSNNGVAIGYMSRVRAPNMTTIAWDVNVPGHVQIGNGKDMNVGLQDGDVNISHNLYVTDGNVYATNLIDLTPAWTGTTKQALEQLTATRNIGTEIDHSSLPDFTKGTTIIKDYIKTGEECKYELQKHKWCGDDNDLCDANWETTSVRVCKSIMTLTPVGEIEGRNIGATVTMLVEAVKALKTELCTIKPTSDLCN